MTNSDIADILGIYAKLSELHNGNPFKIKSYAAAAFKIDKIVEPLCGKSIEELEKIDGVGKAISQKVFEICTTESFKELEDLYNQTPSGVLDIMKVKGIGPKKVAHIWHDLGIETLGELLYACTENRLAQAKGFGLKTQASVIKQIEFIYASANKFHYHKLATVANALVALLSIELKSESISICGQLRRKLEVVDYAEILITSTSLEDLSNNIFKLNFLSNVLLEPTKITANFEGYPIVIYSCLPQEFAYNLLKISSAEEHLVQIKLTKENKTLPTEESIYQNLNLPFIEPELREGLFEFNLAQQNALPKLIQYSDLKGALHNHSTWSDGLNTIEEMAKHCIKQGWQYLGLADHSKAAFYAKGLSEESVLAQQKEIDLLNQKLAPFKIFKGIECDILNDGNLDYNNEILATFDYVVASVHSNLKMTEEKAMTRLLKAIENPFTTILGHPTGRLLLMREGYPVDHKKIIDACAANGVAIEINANPYRLDLDWRHIQYALEKGVLLSVNPDAHELEGLLDMHWGIEVARKGGLSAAFCLNAFDLDKLQTIFNK